MMNKMENGEKVIRMLHHVTIGLQYRSHECALSWVSDNEEGCTELTENYWRKHWMKRSVPWQIDDGSLCLHIPRLVQLQNFVTFTAFLTMIPFQDLNYKCKEEQEAAAAASFAVLLYQLLAAQQAWTEQHQAHSPQIYLHRWKLLPNPCVGMPWQRLWASQDDQAFIKTMGFDVAMFWLLL